MLTLTKSKITISKMNNIKSLYDLYSEVERISRSLPNVNTFTESFDNLNREDVEYSAVVFQFRDGTQPGEGFVTYRFYLGYVDRVNEVSGSPSSNETLIQSVAEQSLRTIINKVNEEVEFKYGTLTPFEQRFTALTSGCYIDCSVTLAVSDCNYESGSVLRELVIDAKANGESEYVPGPGVDGWKKVRLDVDVNSLTDFDGMKYSYSNVTKFPDGLKFAPRTGQNCIDMFSNCSELTEVSLFDTSKATNTQGMFYYCNQLTSAPGFDTSSVTSMSNMFYHCGKLTSVPEYDTSNVTNMSNLFKGCSQLESIPLFDTSKVTDMGYMLYYCDKLTSVPLFDTSKVTNMSNMFYKCGKLTSVPEFNTSNATTMSSLFYSCGQLKSVPKLDTSNVTNAWNMFYHCAQLTTLGGFIGLKASLDLSGSPLLPHDSLLNVINEAADVTASPKNLTLGSTNLAKLTDEEKAIATSKGWTLK